jgi:hypothetical protein
LASSSIPSDLCQRHGLLHGSDVPHTSSVPCSLSAIKTSGSNALTESALYAVLSQKVSNGQVNNPVNKNCDSGVELELATIVRCPPRSDHLAR